MLVSSLLRKALSSQCLQVQVRGFRRPDILFSSLTCFRRLRTFRLPLGRYLALGSPLTGGISTSTQKSIGIWLLSCSGMVVGAVMLGGITRLTESGLSIVDWHLIRGMKPPTNPDDWLHEFEKYKQYPEYNFKTGSRELSLDEFKFIWYMEYLHRMWGRAIGLVFLLPAAYFWSKGRFNRPMKIRVAIMSGLLLFQGLLGWYMVKSGLDPRNNSDAHVPRVSQYRLAAHMTGAVVLYTMLLWSGLSNVLKPHDLSGVQGIKKLRAFAHSSKTAIFLTIIAGALVAGLDAGMVYNSWPKYGSDWFPKDLWEKVPWYTNLTENPAMVQFIHRNLAYLSIATITGTWLVGCRMKLPRRAKTALHCLFAMVYIQAYLGIATLVHYVPVTLGAMHQSGSLAVLTFAFWLTSELRRFPIPK